MTSAPTRGPATPSIGPFVALGFLLVVVELALAVVGWTARVDEPAFYVWFRWSATIGVVLDLLLTAALLQRSVQGLEIVWVFAGSRFVAVVFGFLVFGWRDGGRSDPTYLLLLVLCAVVTSATVVVTLAARRNLRAAVVRTGRPAGR